MKGVIYKNPVIFAVIINILSLIMCIYSTIERNPIFFMSLAFIGIVNRRIIDNGNNLNKKKKIIIYSSFFLMITISCIYSFYMYKTRYNQIINGL